jgi:FtsX-like permease family
VRRTTADAASTAGVIAATAFAIAAWCTAVILTDSTTEALRDTAGTFVGADEAIRTNNSKPLPSSLQGRATVVARQLARSGDFAVDVLGIDPATFRDGAHLTSNVPQRLLDDISKPVAPGEAIPVIVVGRPLDDDALGTQQRDEKKLPVRLVGALDSFPGYNNGSSLVVMSRDALTASPLGSYQEVWIRDPQPGDPKALTDSGTSVYATSVASDIFDVTSFLALRWSFDATKAFGVLVGSVIVTVLLLVLDARSRARQATYLLAARMGLRPRQHLRALVIELGVPLLGGFGLGVLLAIASTRLSVSRLDSLRNLQPPARQIVQLGEMSGGLVVVVAVVAALAAWGQVITLRGRPEEVLRATE